MLEIPTQNLQACNGEQQKQMKVKQFLAAVLDVCIRFNRPTKMHMLVLSYEQMLSYDNSMSPVGLVVSCHSVHASELCPYHNLWDIGYGFLSA